MSVRALAAVLISVLVAGCEAPKVEPSADARQQSHSARIDGEVIVQSRARGNVLVFLSDADRDPPPRGSGRPLSFAVVPRDALFDGAAADSQGPFSAPFHFSLVGAGRYKIRAVLDRDGCEGGALDCRRPDLIPWYGVTAEPNALDLAGAAVEPGSSSLRTFEVREREDGTLAPVTGVSVLISDAATVPVDRPAFIVSQILELSAPTPHHVLALRSRPIKEGAVDQRQPVFLVRLVDDDGNGVPDDANADGVPDLWPKVLVRKLAASAPSGLVDENDLDRNGVLDESGVDYAHADGVTDGKPDQVALAAAINPAGYLPQLFDGGTSNFTSLQVNELSLIVRPRALDLSNPSAPAQLQAVPKGDYSVTVIQHTGQTWRLPNELSQAVAPEAGLPTVEGQDFVFRVP